jgi:hypothetical protein
MPPEKGAGSVHVAMKRPLLCSILCAAVACSDEEPRQNPPQTSNDAGVVSQTDTGVPADPDTGVTPDPDAGENPADAGMMNMGNPGIEELVVGTVMIENSGDSLPVNFELPADVTSFAVLIQGQEASTYIVKTLDGPLGNLVTDDPSNVTMIEQFLLGPYAAQFKSPNRAVQDKGLAAAGFPNNPSVQVSGGMYTLVIAGITINGNNANPAPGPVDVKIQYRRAMVAAGHLDLSLYFTGAGGLGADGAPSSQFITGAVERLREIYAQANITVGAINYYDVDPSFQTVTGIDGSSDDLEQLFKNTAGNGPGLHFFFVDRFEAGALPGANVAGVSGGLPGAGLSVGSVNSGVAVALATVMDDANILAHVMAHEGGHWLGLFHTSEIIGTEDQMPDTPGGQAGNTFLMYPAVGGGTSISANQGAVLRQHPEVIAD